MPAPIQISRRTQPTDIDNLYDFVDQSTPYSSSIESDNGSYIPKLEANFCRNFSCCGLNLEDLHDLLQHYEECHVRFEHDDGHQFIDDWSSTDGSAPSSPQPSHASLPSKKNALVSLSDIYSESNETSAFDTSILRTPSANKKKRSIGSISPDALQSSKRLAYSSAFSTPDSSMPSTPTSTSYGPEVVDILNGTTGSLFATQFGMQAGASPYAVAAEEILLRKRDQELAMLDQHISRPATTLVVDKPYKCQVAGCDKAYKNPNGLKYHNQHGHCNNNNGIDGDKPINKPYKCSIIECGKRYKNLNGLKYHVQHTHMPHQAMQALH